MSDSVLASVSSLTVFIECGKCHYYGTSIIPPSFSLFLEIRRILGIVGDEASNLSTVRIALQLQNQHVLQSPHSPCPGFVEGHYLPQPAPAMANLPLFQRLEAYRLGHNVWMGDALRTTLILNHSVTQVATSTRKMQKLRGTGLLKRLKSSGRTQKNPCRATMGFNLGKLPTDCRTCSGDGGRRKVRTRQKLGSKH
jgi:hypothetical protein